MEHLHAYVHDDIAAKLRAHAAASDRSLAGELRRALRLYVEMLDRRSIDPAGPAVDDLTAGPGLTPPEARPPAAGARPPSAPAALKPP